jgi:hypothetical protein
MRTARAPIPVSRTSFASPELARAALADFLRRGYTVASRRTQALWPGEARMPSTTEVEWCPAHLDPAEPLWELLRQLHAAGQALALAAALYLLLERRLPPRQVVAIISGGSL